MVVNHTREIRVGYQNVQGQSVATLIALEMADRMEWEVVGISEPWIGKRPNTGGTETHKNYKIASIIGEDTRVVVYVRTTVKDWTQFGPGTSWTGIMINGAAFIMLYASPMISNAQFSTLLNDIILPNTNTSVTYCGDFNTHHTQWGGAQTASTSKGKTLLQ